MNLINTDIKPDPFDPHRGDVYESGGPFPQRIVVESPPTSEDQRIRYRVDGGVDSNLTTLGQFHLHLAGLGEIRGVGRVREYSPLSPDEMRGAAAAIVERRISDVVKADLAEANNTDLAKFVHGEPVSAEMLPFANLSIADIGHAAWLCGYHPGDDPMEVFKRAAHRAQGWLEIEAALADDMAKAKTLQPGLTLLALVNSQQSAGELLVNTAQRLVALSDAVAGSGSKAPRSDVDLIRAATNARQIADQVRVAVRFLGFKWDDSKADAGHALVKAVRAEKKFASDLALELNSISAFIAPHGVAIPAGATVPTSLELVRWLAVTGGVVPHACHPTLAEIQEAQEVDSRARWDRYERSKRKPAIDEPARPEHADRTEPSFNPIYCTGFVTVLAVKDRQIVQRQSWASDKPGFKATDVSFHDDDPRLGSDLELGERQGTWTWRGAICMAASVVNGLSEAVVILAGLAASFLEFIGSAMDWWNGSEGMREQRARVLMDVSPEKYSNFGAALKDVDKRKAEGWYGDDRNGATKLAGSIREAAATWRSSDIKNLNEADIASWTDTVSTKITDFFKPKEDDKKTKKGPSVNIGNLYMPPHRGRRRVERHRTIGGHELVQVLAAVQRAKTAGATMVVERPYFNTSFGNVLTFDTLVVVRQRFVDLCKIYGVPCHVVYPATWQVFLKHCPVGAVSVVKKTQKLTKLQAAWLFAKIYGEREVCEHEIDAALMGRWWGFTHGT